jgi:phosphatidylinositol alpha-mannosyltransferase
VLKLAAWLGDAGHEAWVVGPGDGPESTISVGGTIVINANGSSTPIALSPRAARRVLSAVDGADVVHVHEPLMPFVSLAATLAVKASSVGTFHADAPRAVRWGYRRWFSAAGGRVGRLDEVTAVSPVAAAGLTAIPHDIVPNGLDVAGFGAAGGKDPGTVMFLGRDDPRKGLDTFVAAAGEIAGRRQDVSFVVAGTDRKERVGPIEFVGRVSEATKRDLLASAEVFVAPHRGGESFGIVVAEAMAAGCAVVASALPAFAYVLGDAGLLVSPGDHHGVAEAVLRFLTDDELRRSHQAKAADRAERFDRARVVDGYLDVYRRAMASR